MLESKTRSWKTTRMPRHDISYTFLQHIFLQMVTFQSIERLFPTPKQQKERKKNLTKQMTKSIFNYFDIDRVGMMIINSILRLERFKHDGKI